MKSADPVWIRARRATRALQASCPVHRVNATLRSSSTVGARSERKSSDFCSPLGPALRQTPEIFFSSLARLAAVNLHYRLVGLVEHKRVWEKCHEVSARRRPSAVK